MTPAPLPDAADLLQALNVAPSLKQALSVPHEFLAQRHEKAARRRFYEQPECVTGFDELHGVDALIALHNDYCARQA